MTSMNKYNYVAENVDTNKLVRGPKGLRLEAKAAYRNGQAMLTVYGFWRTNVEARYSGSSTVRCVLQRVFVPRDTPKAEKRRMLQAMCDLFAVKHGTEYALRSKLK
jgi:hypothetical protein